MDFPLHDLGAGTLVLRTGGDRLEAGSRNSVTRRRNPFYRMLAIYAIGGDANTTLRDRLGLSASPL